MSMMSSPLYTKPLASGAVAVALDKYVLGQPNFNSSLYFGGSVAVGEALSVIVTPAVPSLIPFNMGNSISGKTLTQRAVEIGLSTGSGWTMNKYILKNEISREDWTKRMAVIAASSFLGEYISDYLQGNPLSWLK